MLQWTYTKKRGEKVEQTKLYSAKELGKILHMTKQGVNKWEREGKIEKPAFFITIGKEKKVKGWTKEQVERIRRANHV